MQAVLTLLAYIFTFASTLSIASCTATSCNYSAFSAAINTLYVGAIILLAASGVAMLRLRAAHSRAMLWTPIMGSVLLIVLLSGTYVAGRAALALPLFGNRLPGCC